MLKVCAVGPVTWDTIRVGNRCRKPSIGGTAFFSSVAYRELGFNTEVVTKVSKNDRTILLTQLERSGIKVKYRTSAATLTFENSYRSAGSNLRTQRILKLSDPLSINDLKNVAATVFHIGPLVAGDVKLPLVRALSKRGTVVLDAQGLLRPRKIGKVVQKMSSEVIDIIKYVNILKMDATEAALVTSVQNLNKACLILQGWGAHDVIITDGSNGSILRSRENTWRIPAFPPKHSTDPTGCGDTYLAGYVSARLKGITPYESAHIGAAAASHKLQYFGPLRTSFSFLWQQSQSNNGSTDPVKT